MISTKVNRSIESKTPQLCRVGLACAIYVCFAATTGFASEYHYAVDQHPTRIGANVWRFVVNVGVRPVGALQFVSSQFTFASATQGIEVDYDFNGPGIDFQDDRAFIGIGPTLFDQIHGFINGWNSVDLNDGIFSGVVQATDELTTVEFEIEADSFVPVRQRPLSARRSLSR